MGLATFKQHAKCELYLLRRHWKIVLLAAVWQWVHSTATNIAYYLHVRRNLLPDIGFTFLPALTKQTQIYSEYVFFVFLFSTIAFALSPFFYNPITKQARLCQRDDENPLLANVSNTTHMPERLVQLGLRPADVMARGGYFPKQDGFAHPPLGKRYTVIMLRRFGCVLVIAQTLRILSFLATGLPGPNYHCRLGSSEYAPPTSLDEILWRTDAFLGCGDLVFSSHTIFVNLCALSWTKYSRIPRSWKVALWIFVAVFCTLVIAARKHYSIDIFIAMYIVPALWVGFDYCFPDVYPTELYKLEGAL